MCLLLGGQSVARTATTWVDTHWKGLQDALLCAGTPAHAVTMRVFCCVKVARDDRCVDVHVVGVQDFLQWQMRQAGQPAGSELVLAARRRLWDASSLHVPVARWLGCSKDSNYMG